MSTNSMPDVSIKERRLSLLIKLLMLGDVCFSVAFYLAVRQCAIVASTLAITSALLIYTIIWLYYEHSNIASTITNLNSERLNVSKTATARCNDDHTSEPVDQSPSYDVDYLLIQLLKIAVIVMPAVGIINTLSLSVQVVYSILATFNLIVCLLRR